MLNSHVTMYAKRFVCYGPGYGRAASLSCMSRGWTQHQPQRAIRCQSASPRSSDVNDPSTGSCCGSGSSCCSSKSAPGITGGMAQPNLAFLKESLVQADMVTLSRQDMLTAFQDSQAMMSAAGSSSEEKVVDITELLRGMPSDLVFTDDDWEEDEETSA